jgi:hypothetical protein
LAFIRQTESEAATAAIVFDELAAAANTMIYLNNAGEVDTEKSYTQ